MVRGGGADVRVEGRGRGQQLDRMQGAGGFGWKGEAEGVLWARGRVVAERGLMVVNRSRGWLVCGKEGRRARHAARADFGWKARLMPERATRRRSQAAYGLEGGAESSSRGSRAALGMLRRGGCAKAVPRAGRRGGPRAARSRRCEAVKQASRASRAFVEVAASKLLSCVISALGFYLEFFHDSKLIDIYLYFNKR